MKYTGSPPAHFQAVRLLCIEAGHRCTGSAVNDDLVGRMLDAGKVVGEGVQVCLGLL